MKFDVIKTTVRGISALSDSDIKSSLLGEMVGGKCFQFISPRHSKSGKGELIIWLQFA
jgi:hypothetical protein